MRGPLWSDEGKYRLRIQRALDACTGAEFSHSLDWVLPVGFGRRVTAVTGTGL